jgi:WD40 repeat protein
LLFQNDKAIYVIEFMPDGKEFFTAGQDSIVRWHDVESGRVLRQLDTQQKEINCVSYNPSRTIFATAGDDGTAKVWDAASRMLLKTIKVGDDVCYFAKFLSDDSVITSGNSEDDRLFNVATGQLLREYKPATPNLPRGSFGASVTAYISKLGDRFWTSENWGDNLLYQGLYEWNVETGKPLRLSEDVQICNILSDRSEKYVFINSSRGDLRVFDAVSHEEMQSIHVRTRIEAMGMSPDERRLVAGDVDGQLQIWPLDLSNPSLIIAPESPLRIKVHEELIYAMRFAPDGESILTAGRDGSVRRTHLMSSKSPVRELEWAGRTNRICVPLPGTDLVVATRPLSVRNRSTGDTVKLLSTEYCTHVDTNINGTLIAAGSGNHVEVWNVAKGERLLRLDEKRRWTSTMDFSWDSSLLAVESRDFSDKRVDIVDLATKKIERISEPGVSSGWLGFCTDDDLAVGIGGSQLVCWNMRDRTVRWELKPFDGTYGSGALTCDRKLLLAASGKELRLLDSATGRVIYTVPCEYDVSSLVFIGDGRTFVVGGKEGQVSVWHTSSGQRLFNICDLGTRVYYLDSFGDGFLAGTRGVSEDRRSNIHRWYEF